MTLLDSTLAAIGPLDRAAMAAAQARQDLLTKPHGALGRLEAISVQVAGITGRALPHVSNKAVIVMAGDHGVVAEGVSAYPSAVTPQMVLNFLRGGAAINVLARHVGARVLVVDAGVASDIPVQPGLVVKKVAYGTANMRRGPAMTRAQAIQAVEAGIEALQAELAGGLDVVATGDMGIGNTTPSSAIVAAVTGLPVAQVTGRGTGIDGEGLQRKVAIIEDVLRANQPDPHDGLDLLAKVGGFEIGGIAGVILGAAAHRVPVVVDGFISTAAAIIAGLLAPQARDYMISGHKSVEIGHRAALEYLGLVPLVDLDLRLGEGTGAVLGISLVEAACKLLCEMATFDAAGVERRQV
ncbi:MAG TPA: nicotinate-nucleotide--dimethylbenzimidazole phosphoribosyltransferase [Anaerolineae bacterium]|nr:nicotinate-nucleotide--dimethylbenzimidazole phosphoribosyltransferase [Anaerolineae bacterium]HOQ99961.1 nicotinate-nucleotide--dimethylbenzimidazole phosphoribosyltransferase [Anaerolineae bacterium]HPL28196.1 nicotinate-nucleotide--dimethylbenzimidazole phosphoribosyltransferase [Anaerolineae bacterium]